MGTDEGHGPRGAAAAAPPRSAMAGARSWPGRCAGERSLRAVGVAIGLAQTDDCRVLMSFPGAAPAGRTVRFLRGWGRTLLCGASRDPCAGTSMRWAACGDRAAITHSDSGEPGDRSSTICFHMLKGGCFLARRSPRPARGTESAATAPRGRTRARVFAVTAATARAGLLRKGGLRSGGRVLDQGR